MGLRVKAIRGPRRVRDLTRFLPLKSQLVLAGNVRDLLTWSVGGTATTASLPDWSRHAQSLRGLSARQWIRMAFLPRLFARYRASSAFFIAMVNETVVGGSTQPPTLAEHS